MKVTTEKDGVVLTCNRDHCTPEERAVIEVAEQYYELRLMQGGTTRTLSELVETVAAMLTARAKTEETGK